MVSERMNAALDALTRSYTATLVDSVFEPSPLYARLSEIGRCAWLQRGATDDEAALLEALRG
jgi:hypothetical protein